jgi:hypothetical protein
LLSPLLSKRQKNLSGEPEGFFLQRWMSRQRWEEGKENDMFKVKTFGSEMRPLKTMHELADLDEKVNRFIDENNVKKVITVSDTATTDDTGATIGLIRVLAYEV